MLARWALASRLALALVLGCGGDDSGEGPGRAGTRTASMSDPPAGAARPGHAGEGVEVHGTPPDQPPARIVRFEGAVSRTRGTTLAPGDGLEAGDGVIVRGEGRADVDLGGGGRVAIERDTEIRIGDGGPAQILLLRGALHASVPPGPSGPRPPLRVATPAASIDLGGSGEFYVLAHPSGASWICGLAGVTTISTGESDGRRRLRTIELTPGRALLVGARGMAEPTDGPTRLEEARGAAVTLLGTSAVADPERARRELDEVARRLDESLFWLETETRRGRDLTAQHREAVRTGQGDDAMRLQRELVAHSQQLYLLRQVATARWERLLTGSLELARLEGARAASATALADTRRDRVRSLLGP